MSFLDKLYIQKFHEAKIEKYGSGNAQSLGWFTKESQLKRFGILTRALELDGASVLDIGCGNGDLCQYLSQKFTGFTYSGLDIVDTFLDNAIEQNKNCAAAFYLGDFMAGQLPPADYIFACGSLSYKNNDPAFIFKAIERLYQQSNIAFCFNLLSTTVNPDGILVAYPAVEIKEYCNTLTPNVILEEDYEEGDFTVRMFRP